MPRKSLLITIAICILLAGTIVFLLLPTIGNMFIFSLTTGKLPFAQHEISLVELTPWRLEGKLSLGEKEKPGIVLPTFSLHYAPRDLLRKEIAELRIESAVIHLEKKGDKLVLRGMQETVPAAEQQNSLPLSLPLAVRKVAMKNSMVIFHGSSNTVFLGVDGTFTLQYEVSDGHKVQSIQGSLQTSGALPATIEAAARSTSTGYETALDIETAGLRNVAGFLPLPAINEFDGQLRISTILQTQGTAGISNYDGTAKLAGLRLRGKGFLLENENDEPVSLQFQGDTASLQYQLTGLIAGDPKAAIELEGSYGLDNGKAKGVLTLVPRRTGTSVMVEYQGALLSQKLSLNFRLHGDPFTLESLNIKGYEAEGEVSLSGESVSGKIQVHADEIVEQDLKVELIDLTLDLPFSYPPETKDTAVAGNLSIEEIRYRDADSGRLVASITPSAREVRVDALLTTPLHDDLEISCSGSAGMEKEAELGCILPEVEIASSDLPAYIDLPGSVSFAGRIAAEFHLKISGSRARKMPQGSLQLHLREGNVEYNEHTLTDISADIDFPELPRLRSSAGQRLNIGSIDFGGISMSDARIYFRIDDSQTLFVEKVQLDWSGGKVEAAGFRIYEDMEQLETTFYCDRLRLTQLLHQFGIGDAEGEGSLNGRLPVIINRESISFDDGFLFSTPGKSGIVRFGNTEQLRRGMEAMERSPYLEYTMDALQNFSYNWTTLTFNTEQEMLLLSLQLDGKPAERLSYGFRNGRIVSTTEGPGIQHPLRVDLNFRLPLNDLFRYGKNIQSILENM